MPTAVTVFGGFSSGIIAVTSTLRYLCPFGHGGTPGTSQAANVILPIDTVATDFRVTLATAPGSGNTSQFRLENTGVLGNSQFLTVNIADLETTGIDSSFVSWDTIAADTGQGLLVTAQSTAGTPAASAYYWSFRLIPATDDQQILGGTSVTNKLSDTDICYSSFGGTNAPDTSEFSQEMVFPTAGTISALHIRLGTQPATDTGWIFTVRKNGVDTAMTLTLSGDDFGTDTDPAHSFAVVAGDTITLKSDPFYAPTISSLTQSVIFTPTTGGEQIIPVSGSSDNVNSATRYHSLWSGSVVLDATESNARLMGDTFNSRCTISGMQVLHETNPGPLANNYTYTLMQNGSATGLSVAVADLIGSATANVPVTVENLFSTRVVPDASFGNPNVTKAHISYVAKTTPALIRIKEAIIKEMIA